jgi:hypothetical protein
MPRHRGSAAAANADSCCPTRRCVAQEACTAAPLDRGDGGVERDARYGFPGWPTEETTPGGKTKRVDLERYRVAAKAHEFLAGAKSAGEIAGRCLALAVMAVLVDEECVARSNRSMVDLHAYRPAAYVVPGAERTDVPWTRDVVRLLETSRSSDCPSTSPRRSVPAAKPSGPRRSSAPRRKQSQAFIESWFSKLKQRCVWREEFETLDEARATIGAYVERYHHRPHSRLAYRTPREVAATWQDHDDQLTPAA